jgi:hypothetical protein
MFELSEVRFSIDEFGNIIAYSSKGHSNVVLPYLHPVSLIDRKDGSATIILHEGTRYRLVVAGDHAPRARDLIEICTEEDPPYTRAANKSSDGGDFRSHAD